MIKGFIGTSLVDYPGKVASVIFTGGCNLRCPYCYNVELVLPERVSRLPDIPADHVLAQIERRKGFIDGVVVTGGEPLLHVDRLIPLAERMRKMGFLVKVDTNGTLPEALERILGHVDYVAMDVKTAPDMYPVLGGRWEPVEESLEILKSSGVDYEIRITAVPTLVNEEILLRLKPYLRGVKRVVLQKFVNSKEMIDSSLKKVHPYTPEQMKRLEELIRS